MTVLAERATAARSSVGPVVGELALFEATKMLRNPLTIVGAAGSLWAMWVLIGGRALVDPHHIDVVTIGRGDALLARQLLNMPQVGVHDKLMEHWEEVLDPATPSAQVAAWFGLPAPDQGELEFFQGPCT